jgi:serine/threonine-protein kinase
MLSTIAAASPLDHCRPTVVCTVKVEQLPAVLLSSGDYELQISGQVPMLLPSTGLAHVAIQAPSVVSLDGAAYRGSVSLNPADCGGEAVHVISAAPKPAVLEFQAGAVPLSDMVVSCVSGCSQKLRAADDFPELPFPQDATELVVELEFKARGHRSLIGEFKLNPGHNLVRISMQRID